MTTPGLLRSSRCVVVGGAGAVGGMLVDLLLGAHASVCVVDVAAPPAGAAAACESLRGDVCAMGPQVEAELGGADVVVLAVPEPVALRAVERVAGAMAPGALLVDTLSVKGPIVAAIGACAAGLEAVSLNPMFAPSLGIEGRAVAAVVVHDGPRCRELLALLARRGARVVEVGADEHDALAAATQALTHAAVLSFGLALAELEVDVRELGAVAPPPHTTLLALLARITSGADETYWDVQAGNPHAARARAALATGMRRLADIVDGADAAGFAAVLEQLRGLMGPELQSYHDVCQQLFDATQPPRPEVDLQRMMTTTDTGVKR